MWAMATHENELTTPTDECLPDGRLNPAARGWSRRPLLRSNLRGPWGRVKRWEYWCVTGEDRAVAITYADVDYIGLAGLWCCDLRSGFEVEKTAIVPGSRGIDLSDRVDTGGGRYEGQGVRVEIHELTDRTELRAGFLDRSAGRVEVAIDVARPPGHETLNVLIPWSDRRFQFTSKQNTRPATGTAVIGDRVWEFGDGSYGTLDHGRGVWPYSTRWNWGSGSGTSAGHTIGLQLGGRWTVGTGYTENGLCIDGRLTKIGDELEWQYDWAAPLRPWRVTSPGGELDLTLEPFHDRHRATRAVIASTEVHQVFGHWSGTVRPDSPDGSTGEAIAISGILGWAEESRSRW